MAAIGSDVPDKMKCDNALKKALPLLSNGGLDGARMVVEREIDRSPDSWEGWAAKADILYLQGLNKYALQCSEKALSLKPDNALAWNTKGNILYKQGKYEEAIKCYNRAIEIEPLFVRAWYNKRLAVERQLNSSKPRISYVAARRSDRVKRSDR